MVLASMLPESHSIAVEGAALHCSERGETYAIEVSEKQNWREE